jgi:hypothetical protein
VVSVSLSQDQLFDQRCRILAESFGALFEVEDGWNPPTADHPPGSLLKRVHSMVEELMSDNDEYDNRGEDQDPTATAALEPSQEVELKFESFVAKISVGIPVGAYYLNRKVMCTVSLVCS